MKVYTDGQFDKKNGCVLALGSFDALHAAHMKLLHTAAEQAKKYNVRSGVHLFSKRIENVIFPGVKHKCIYENTERIAIIEDAGVDFAYFENFDEHYMKMGAYDFAKMLKDKFGAVCVVAGFHYTFGYMGEGSAEMLKRLGAGLGFDVVIVPPITLDGVLISSTQIRLCIQNGDIIKANRLLGRHYSLSGMVIPERGVGRSMGLPTANIKVGEDVLLPKNGVYAAYAYIDGKAYPGVTNVGTRPTFDLNTISVEVHIVGFDGDLYGQRLRICFLDRLRDEKKFLLKEDLRKQILSDIDKAKQLFFSNRLVNK